jgi:hypothetical protein
MEVLARLIAGMCQAALFLLEVLRLPRRFGEAPSVKLDSKKEAKTLISWHQKVALIVGYMLAAFVLRAPPKAMMKVKSALGEAGAVPVLMDTIPRFDQDLQARLWPMRGRTVEARLAAGSLIRERWCTF